MSIRPVFVALGLTMSITLAACTDGVAERAPDKPPPAAARLEVEPKPVYRGGSDKVPNLPASSIGFVDDLAFVDGKENGLAALDAATGAKRWHAGPESPRPGIGLKFLGADGYHARTPVVGVGDEWTAFVFYVSSDDAAERVRGLAAIRVDDGSVRWKSPSERFRSGFDFVVAADQQTVLGRAGGTSAQPVVAVAAKAEDGSPLWQKPGVWPRAVANNRVIGTASDRKPELKLGPAHVVGLDAGSGKEVWSLRDDYARSVVDNVIGDVALVFVQRAAGSGEEAVLIDIDTGKEVAPLGAAPWGPGTDACAGDERRVACVVDETGGKRLVTFDVDSRRVHRSATRADELPIIGIEGVWRDYIFVKASVNGAEEHRAVDRDGRFVSGALRGRFIGMSEAYVAFAPTSTQDGPYAVYRVRKG